MDNNLLFIFKEFVLLEEPDSLREGPKILKDFKISDYVIARDYGTDWRLCYLDSGNRLKIPRAWINLFSDFLNHSGNLVLSRIPLDPLELYLYRMVKHCSFIQRTLSKTNGRELLDNLGDLVEYRTANFRAWAQTEVNIDYLRPWEFQLLNETIEV